MTTRVDASLLSRRTTSSARVSTSRGWRPWRRNWACRATTATLSDAWCTHFSSPRSNIRASAYVPASAEVQSAVHKLISAYVYVCVIVVAPTCGQVEDPRTSDSNVYADDCIPSGAAFFGVGVQVDANNKVTKKGSVNGSLVVELNGGVTHTTTTFVFSILATEVVSVSQFSYA